MGEAVELLVDGVQIPALVSRPATTPSAAARRFGLVLGHAPVEEGWGPAPAPEPFSVLGDRLANDSGWVVLSLVLGGVPGSPGRFPRRWLDEMRAALDRLLEQDAVEGAWLAGFGIAGTMALCLAGLDDRVQGVGALAAPADVHDWLGDGPPPRELADLVPVDLIGRIPPRPVLLVHGADDDVVPLMDARILADAAEGEVDFRVLAGAGHGLSYDPRAVAILLGWMDRQAI